MRTRSDHREAVARRLELLRVEADPDRPPPPDGEPWWETAPVVELASSVVDDPGAPAVPVPGRHAARRRWSPSGWLVGRAEEAVPATLRGRVGIGPWHLTVLALLVAAGLAATVWWVVRGDPSVVPVPSGGAAPLVPLGTPGGPPAATTAPASGAPAGAASAGGASAGAAGTVTVDVAGKVRHPGVVDLPAGSRVLDAIEAAGGTRPGVDLSGLNRARILADGEQILVGTSAGPSSTGPAAPGPAAGAVAGAPGALVDLNTATVDELDTLPEVGPVTAQAILDYRTQHGGFGSVDELLDIEGIGEKTLAKIAPHVTV